MSSIRTLSNGGTNTNAKMKRQEKAEKIGIILNELYPTTPIPLGSRQRLYADCCRNAICTND